MSKITRLLILAASASFWALSAGCGEKPLHNCFEVVLVSDVSEGRCDMEAYVGIHEGVPGFYKTSDTSGKTSVWLADVEYSDAVLSAIEHNHAKVHVEGYYERLSEDTITIIRVDSDY